MFSPGGSEDAMQPLAAGALQTGNGKKEIF
jgi:hypothetical protein